MQRLSLLIVSFTLLLTASGCCCGWGHGCNSCCGYPSACGYAPPVYPAQPACPTCPTCPGGGCGMQPGVYPSSYYEPLGTHLSSAATPAAPTLASADALPTY